MSKQKVIIIASLTAFILIVSFCYRSYIRNSEKVTNNTNKPSQTALDIHEATPAVTISIKESPAGSQPVESNPMKDLVPTLRNIIPINPNKLGAVSNSLQSLCMFSYQGPWIYFSARLDDYYGLYRSMPDRETGIVKLDDAQAQFINVVDQWVYYFDKSLKKIYRISINGKHKTELAEGNIISMLVYEDWIYYSKITQDGFGIYRMQSDGSNNSFITLGDRFTVSDDGKWLCFQRYDTVSDNYSFYRASMNGNSEVKIGAFGCQIFQVYNGWIYAALNTELNSELVRLKSDGSDMTVLDKINLQSFVICDDWIYELEYNGDLYKIRTDGSGKTLLFKGSAQTRLAAVNVVEDWIFLIPMEGSSTIRIKNAITNESHVLD